MNTTRRFPHKAGAVPAARHFVGGLIESDSLDFRQDVEVMVSELVSNCVRHTTSDFEVSVDLTEESIRVEVSDRGAGTPRVGRPPPSQPTGRGLQIVDLLADEWGVLDATDGSGGKTVWFAMARAAAAGEPRDAAEALQVGPAHDIRGAEATSATGGPTAYDDEAGAGARACRRAAGSARHAGHRHRSRPSRHALVSVSRR